MGRDDDIADFLPRPPPAAPARREAAIAEAVRRFEGGVAPEGGRETAPAPWWTRINFPAAGALAAACVVALVAVPVAWDTVPDHAVEDYSANSSEAVADAADASPELADAVPSPADDAVSADAAAPSAAPAETEAGPAPAADDAALEPPRPAGRRAAASGADPAPSDAAEGESAAVVVTGSRIRRPNLESASPVTAFTEDEAAARRAAPAAARGDWNACTIDDPARNLAACRRLIDPAGKGGRGRAAALLADGLAQAWQGDHAKAIAAFDRAIAIERRSALAYLNRGLAWRSRGDLTRALADLDRAIRHDPAAARGYYHRSLLLRQRGDVQRARADEARAVQLDARYAPLLRP